MKITPLLFIFSLTIFSSCKKEDTFFNEPHPINTKDLSKFPNRFVGTYSNPNLNATIILGNDYVIKELHENDTILLEKYDKLKDSEKELYVKISDLIAVNYKKKVDTIFNIKEGDILRKFKGNYYLNNKEEDDKWQLSQLILNRKFLNIREVSDKYDIKKLEDITANNSNDTLDTDLYHLNKKQFKEFLKNNGFSKTDTYLRE